MSDIIDTIWLNNLPAEQRERVRLWLRRHRRPTFMGSLRRTTPISNDYGYDRGTPVDRYYIDRYLEQHKRDIQGTVLEVKDNDYTKIYGVGVKQSEIVDIDPQNPRATLVADLAAADCIPSNHFDCFVFTQTLQLIYDFQSAIRHAHRILRPGGVLLVTVPSTCRVIPGWGLENDYWRFTAASCQRMFGDIFSPENVQVQSYGNVLSSIAFLAGMAWEELTKEELDVVDPFFPLILGVRAVKAG
jgi:SAM-dependent methyltransferase